MQGFVPEKVHTDDSTECAAKEGNPEQYAFSDTVAPLDRLSFVNAVLEEANDAKETFTQCIMFTSSFHSPKEGGGAWMPDEEYTDWHWWLGRSDGGQWKLMTWGY